jgi:hypothetical protein
VELHGGTITAQSLGDGQGATFVVRIPAVPRSTTASVGPGSHVFAGHQATPASAR